MKVLGLILELNPPHKGHEYFINQAKELVNPDITIAIISSSFSMRGDIIVVDKFTRTKLLLDLGVDIVMELPTISSLNSADYFSYNSCYILNKMGITDLCFGAETSSISKLLLMKDVLYNQSYQNYIKENINKGFSYASSTSKALLELSKNNPNINEIINDFSLPNNTLAIQYLKALDTINPNIKVNVIQRIDNNYYDLDLSSTKIASATSIRESLKNNINVKDYLIKDLPLIDINQSYNNLLLLLKYKLIDTLELTNILGVKEGIENRIINYINNSSSYDELVNNITTKRYTKTKVQRLLIAILGNINNTYENKYVYYLRILGLSSNGDKYLKTLNKIIRKEIITTFKNASSDVIDLELKITKLYGLITNNESLYLNEYKIPIKLEVENDN